MYPQCDWQPPPIPATEGSVLLISVSLYRTGVVLEGGGRMASNVAGASGGAMYALYGSILDLRLLNGSSMTHNRANATGPSAANSDGGGCGGAAAVGASGNISGFEVAGGSGLDDNWSGASGGALCTLSGMLQV